MAFTNYKYGTGLRNVGSYQISGHPYLTGSADMGGADQEIKIEFPYVAKSVTIIASASTDQDPAIFKIHFNSTGALGDVLTNNAHHYITLDSDEDSMTFDIKCKEIYLTTVSANPGFQLFAALTNIPTSSMYSLTGSGLTAPPETFS